MFAAPAGMQVALIIISATAIMDLKYAGNKFLENEWWACANCACPPIKKGSKNHLKNNLRVIGKCPEPKNVVFFNVCKLAYRKIDFPLFAAKNFLI